MENIINNDLKLKAEIAISNAIEDKTAEWVLPDGELNKQLFGTVNGVIKKMVSDKDFLRNQVKNGKKVDVSFMTEEFSECLAQLYDKHFISGGDSYAAIDAELHKDYPKISSQECEQLLVKHLAGVAADAALKELGQGESLGKSR